MPAKKPAAGADAPVANPHRGEISITLSGMTFVLRPDFEAVAAIDEQVDGVMLLLRRVVAQPGSLTLHELAVIVTEGIRASGRAAKSTDAHVKFDKIKRMIFETGIPVAVEPAIRFLTAAVTGGAKADETAPGND